MGQFAPIGDSEIHGMMRRLEMVELALTGTLHGITHPLLQEQAGIDQAKAQRSPERIRAAKVREKIRRRRARSRYFPDDLFADPAWDMLLDLYASHYEGMQVSVSSLCIAAAVPATTALRWIKTMTDDGWLVRDADAEDGRRIFVSLSATAMQKLDAYFEEEF